MSKLSALLSVLLALGLAVCIVMASSVREMHFLSDTLLDGSGQADHFRNEWYSRHLRAMSEPVLRPGHGQRSYRFLWLRTFDRPVAVRITATGEKYSLRAVELDGAGGYEPGAISREVTRELTPDEASEIESLLKAQHFWNLTPDDGPSGLDGSRWIVEGCAAECHVIDRWTPGSGPAREIGERFLALTGWEYAEEAYY